MPALRILVSGAAGFVGRHMLSELARAGHEILALDRSFVRDPEGVRQIVKADICDARVMDALIASLKPDACIHLAAMTFVPHGTSDPSRMFAVNVTGTLNILDSFRRHAPTARLLAVSTAHIYGFGSETTPLNEEAPICPQSIYAITKATADLTALNYAREYGMQVLTVRPSNHTGPGQSPDFVVPSLVRQIRTIATQPPAKPAVLTVGNLDSIRDFSDVRDVVRAYRLLIERGRPGLAYNVAAGNRVSIADVLKRICDLTGVHPEIVVDPRKVRPTDNLPALDTTRLTQDTGWRPEIPFDQTLADMVKNP